MRPIRRHDLAPRIEIMPLIDVIFLLLTFFIYSLVTMVRAEILPVQLQPLTTSRAAEPASILAITIDSRGRYYVNREPISAESLDAKLSEIAKLDDPPTLFLAMEDAPQADGSMHEQLPGSGVDRGPLLINLIDHVRQAGMTEFNIVGERTE